MAKGKKADAPPKAKPTVQDNPLKKRTRKPSAKAAASSDSEKESADENPEERGDIEWNTDVTLSKSLITAITDNRKIKQALFSSPGSNVSGSKGSGKPKTEYHWILCQILFKDHPTYSEAFQKILDCTETKKAAALRRLWGNKIKNRLVKMQKITKAHMDTMGQTGAGISHKDQIDMSLDNEFTTKWAIIKASCPWFFEMRELITEQPNIVPAGLGNSESDINMNIFTGGNNGNGDETTSSANDGGGSPTRWDIEDDLDTENVDGAASGNLPSSQLNNEATKSAGKTAARPGTSKLVTRAPKENKKKRKMEEFAEIAGAEEVTRQKELDLAKARAEEKKAKMEAKTAEMAYKAQKLAERSARRKEKADGKATKLRLLKLRQRTSMGDPSQSGYKPSPAFSPFTPGSNSSYSLNASPGQFPTHNTSTLNSNLDFAHTPSTSYYRAGSVGLPADNRSADQSRESFGYADKWR